MLKISSNIDAVLAFTEKAMKQHRFAVSSALNETAFEVREALQKEMDGVFEPGPTPFVRNSVFVKKSTKDTLEAEVFIRYPGGKGVDPNSVLMAEVEGGRRRAKRAEVAFQRVGILPRGFGMVPADGAPLDAFGNVPGSFVVQLISYFQAFGEQGYRANMSEKRRLKLANFGRSQRGYKRIGGVAYFVARGFEETAHLKPGIYLKRGIHGADVKPVFLFVRMPSYRKRFDFAGVARQTAARVFPVAMRRAWERAMATAR